MSAIDHYELGPDAEAELEAFAEAQLWGTPDQVVEKAAYLAEATRTGHLAYAFRYAGVPYEDAVSSMRLFAAEVLRACARSPCHERARRRGAHPQRLQLGPLR